MRILHLFANWKWTGPAEPALLTAAFQAGEHEVLFLSGTAPDGQRSLIVPHVRRRGVPTLEGFALPKHARWRANRLDSHRLSALLADIRPDVVHCHMDNDHRIASFAVREARRRPGGPLLVRTSYDVTGLSGGFRMRRVAARALDGLIVTTQAGFEGTLASYGGSRTTVSIAGTPRPVVLVESGIDLARFDPARFDRAAARAGLGLAPDDVALGIVARVQTHRRFELLLDAVEALGPRLPTLRLMVIGRGTNIQRLLLDPVAERGLGQWVRSVGYLEGDAYPRALAALDGTLFLVPGSDGTCRALREQMAMGLAPLVTPRPPLPEIVEEGVAGLVVEESAEGLRRGIERLVSEPALRQRLGQGAAEAARRRFDAAVQAARVTAFYGQVLEQA